MFFYLDNAVNRNSGPNENYALELFELYLLAAENYRGVGCQDEVPKDKAGNPVGYVDDDVHETTRFFTGWTVNGDDGTLE